MFHNRDTHGLPSSLVKSTITEQWDSTAILCEFISSACVIDFCFAMIECVDFYSVFI